MNYVGAGVVYAIENTVNGGRYIGSTINHKSRWSVHRSTLRKGKHHSFILQKAWDKYGEAAFEFKVLLICAAEDRILYETALMPLQRYNLLRTANESIARGGWHHTAESKAKISAGNKGKSLTEEQCKGISERMTGGVRDAAFRYKARKRQLGVTLSADTKGRLSEALKVARAEDTIRGRKIAREIHALCVAGAKVYATCKQYGMSPTTFYRYVNQLELPLLGHKNRGGTQ